MNTLLSPRDTQWWKVTFTQVLKYFNFVQVYTSTPLHFTVNNCTFYSTFRLRFYNKNIIHDKLVKYNAVLQIKTHIRNSLTIEASKTFLHAIIFSHLHYYISCWSQASKTVLKPIEILFKQALRVFDRKSLNHHHCNVLSKYSLLSFENLILFSEVRLVFKIIHTAAAPPPLKNFF